MLTAPENQPLPSLLGLLWPLPTYTRGAFLTLKSGLPKYTSEDTQELEIQIQTLYLGHTGSRLVLTSSLHNGLHSVPLTSHVPAQHRPGSFSTSRPHFSHFSEELSPSFWTRRTRTAGSGGRGPHCVALLGSA